MKISFNAHLFFTAFAAVLLMATSCNKPEKKKGCTDPNAANYSSLAEEDDGSCVYQNATQIIWNNGSSGSWNDDAFSGAINLNVCSGDTGLVVLELDTIFPDTTGGDTTFMGDQNLVLIKDGSGDVGFTSILFNTQDAYDLYKYYIKLDAILPANSDLSAFSLFINGHELTVLDACGQRRISEMVQLSTNFLNDTAFTTITIPVLEFPNHYVNAMDVVFGLSANSPTGSDTVLILNNIRWSLFE